jgi:hypothetical protein
MSNRPPANDPSLPTEQDFDPFGGGLDEQVAWRNFGGLTLEQANKKYRENPDAYQEDFMFMGGKAFAFYFPVIESYLRETSAYTEYDDRNAWILACGIQLQFTGNTLPDVRHLASRVLDLAEFVQSNIGHFAIEHEEQQRILSAWQELKDHIVIVTQQKLA